MIKASEARKLTDAALVLSLKNGRVDEKVQVMTRIAKAAKVGDCSIYLERCNIEEELKELGYKVTSDGVTIKVEWPHD